ncbi:MAG: sigma-70 family RNA polymerase sigma factor [Akkermansiaceae bacterium]|nr:sigma-70 family RNA polymerase sigma factor [Akkermansiaceae bacterium]
MIKEEQFLRLFVRHERELRGFAMTLLPNVVDAEDVVQDACVAMWQKIGDLQDESVFRPWAYSFVRFTALNKARKRNRSPLVFSEVLVNTLASESESEADLAQAEFDALQTCLKKLPTHQRDVVLQYYHSASAGMAEIASSLQKNVEALYKILQRAREALRLCIERQLTREGFNISAKNTESQ